MRKQSYDIVVTPADIDLGVPNSGHGCALARAICRATNSEAINVIGTGAVFMEDATCHYSATLPDVAWEFQQKYDRHRKVEPITFQLEFTSEC